MSLIRILKYSIVAFNSVIVSPPCPVTRELFNKIFFSSSKAEILSLKSDKSKFKYAIESSRIAISLTIFGGNSLLFESTISGCLTLNCTSKIVKLPFPFA